MLIHKAKEESPSNRVKFISYNGKYPCLCSGVLILEIDGKKYKFGHDYFTKEEESNKPNFDSFWSSGGSVTHDNDWKHPFTEHLKFNNQDEFKKFVSNFVTYNDIKTWIDEKNCILWYEP